MKKRSNGLICSLFAVMGCLLSGCKSDPLLINPRKQYQDTPESRLASELGGNASLELTQKAHSLDKQVGDTANIEEGIGDQFNFFPDKRFPNLSSYGDRYRDGFKDMASVQRSMSIARDNATIYPQVIVGDGHFTDKFCDLKRATLGTYHNICEQITINFAADGLAYESPSEILTVLAHEYGHHLVDKNSGYLNVSGLENEIISDCFAGYMNGYWAKEGKISENEFYSSAKLMIQVSKKEHSTKDVHGDSGQRLGAFMAGAGKAIGKETVEYSNFCVGLDRILDFSSANK